MEIAVGAGILAGAASPTRRLRSSIVRFFLVFLVAADSLRLSWGNCWRGFSGQGGIRQLPKLDVAGSIPVYRSTCMRP
ncbi:MAG TPA: hypothetical protein VGS20_05920 [Candidatus Acidoferrales bacterium]|nr:hypothetical protein [Candidatus Acidoferrales bacterium]